MQSTQHIFSTSFSWPKTPKPIEEAIALAVVLPTIQQANDCVWNHPKIHLNEGYETLDAIKIAKTVVTIDSEAPGANATIKVVDDRGDPVVMLSAVINNGNHCQPMIVPVVYTKGRVSLVPVNFRVCLPDALGDPLQAWLCETFAREFPGVTVP